MTSIVESNEMAMSENGLKILAGVRQGGILLLDQNSIYVNELIQILQSSRIGCNIAHLLAAAIFYADDMCILAPSCIMHTQEPREMCFFGLSKAFVL